MSKRVLVTGASKGLGASIAKKLATKGFEIVVHYGSDEAGAKSTCDAIESSGGKASLLQFDVSNQSDCQEKLSSQIEEHGAFYGVVSNAGITKDTAFPMMTSEDWKKVIDVNLNGFYNVVHPCVMPMVRARKGGRIIAMSSVSGLEGNRGQVNYSASKAGLIGAAKALAFELAKREITVNCVAPGLIDTGMVSEEVYSHAKDMIPMKRMGTPDEVAATVDFLFSDSAAYITRQVISVSGGLA